MTFEFLMRAAFVADESWGYMLEPARTSNEYFLIDGGYSERVLSASNAPRRRVLAAETKTAASSHQQPTT